MSLQVWLPLTKDLRNQGLTNVIVTKSSGSTFSSTGGKLGGCYSFTNSANGIESDYTVTLGTTFSVSLWVRVDNYNQDWSTVFKIYKDGYDYVGLCMNQVSSATHQLGFHIYKNNGSNARTGVTDNYYMPLVAGTWYHLCFIVTPTQVKTYQNNELIRTNNISIDFPPISNYKFALGKAYFSGMECSINDFRLYDHALSPMEVKQISQGLVLHYPLDRGGFGQENLSNFQSIASNWTSDGVTTVNYTDGSYGNVLKITTSATNKRIYHYCSWINGQTYAVSFLAKADTSNVSCDMSRSIANFTSSFTLTTEWKRYSGQIVSTADASNGTLSFRIHNSGVVVYITQIKLELGSIPTPWCPNSSDTLATTMGLNDGIEYDTSGFGNNGEKIGALTYTSNTPRYSVSTHITNGASTRIATPSLSFPNNSVTLSIWFRSTNTSPTNNYHMVVDSVVNRQWYEMCVGNSGGGFFRSGFFVNGSRYADNCGSNTLDGNWHMLTISYDGTTIKRYYDGVLKHSTNITATSGLSSPTALVIGRDGPNANYACVDADVSDFRVYATALSADDVKSLYQNSAYIDNSGNVYGAVHEEV